MKKRKERKKEIVRLTHEENKSHENQNVCCICKNEFDTDDDHKKLYKVRDPCHYTGKFRGTAYDIWNFRYKTTREIPVVFHNGYTNYYHFIIKQLAKEFDCLLECLGKNMEK